MSLLSIRIIVKCDVKGNHHNHQLTQPSVQTEIDRTGRGKLSDIGLLTEDKYNHNKAYCVRFHFNSR